MASVHHVDGIDHTPIYLISEETPWEFTSDRFISGVPLVEVLGRLGPGEHLYFVDYASLPGRTRLTWLA